MQVISKEEAKEKGFSYYFTGKECKHGHREKRLTVNSSCTGCLSGYYKRNRDKVLAYKKIYENTDSYKNSKKFYTAKRRVAKLRATAKWANLEAIKAIYRNCPKGYHVDHIVPLQGENVCGLHVENNLQYLTRAENIEKGNSFDTYE